MIQKRDERFISALSGQSTPGVAAGVTGAEQIHARRALGVSVSVEGLHGKCHVMISLKNTGKCHPKSRKFFSRGRPREANVTAKIKIFSVERILGRRRRAAAPGEWWR